MELEEAHGEGSYAMGRWIEELEVNEKLHGEKAMNRAREESERARELEATAQSSSVFESGW